MIGQLMILLMIPTGYHGESLPENILNISANTGYKFGSTKRLTGRVVGNVKHMEVYEGNRDYILFLADNKLKLTNGRSTEDYHDGLVDTSFVIQSLNLQVELKWTSFFQIDSSRIILVFATIPCLILFDPEGDPQISVYLGNCRSFGNIDGGKEEGKLKLIVDATGDTKNRSRMYVLQTDSAIREVNLEIRSIRTVHYANTGLLNPGTITYNSYNKSLVIATDLGFIEFSLESKSFEVIWDNFELTRTFDHAEALEFGKTTAGYVINENLLVIIYRQRIVFNKVVIINLKTKGFYSYCSNSIKGHSCPFSPQSLLSVGGSLYVGTTRHIYSFVVEFVRYCGPSVGWLTRERFPKKYEYSGLNPLAPGAYMYEERVNINACENTVYITKLEYETSTLNCKRDVDVTEEENSRNDQAFNITAPRLSVGSTYFIDKETGECETNATVRHISDTTASTTTTTTTPTTTATTTLPTTKSTQVTATPQPVTSQTFPTTLNQSVDDSLAVNKRNSNKGYIGAIMTILSITAVIVCSILLLLMLKQRGANHLKSRKLRKAQRVAFQLSDHTLYNVD